MQALMRELQALCRPHGICFHFTCASSPKNEFTFYLLDNPDCIVHVCTGIFDADLFIASMVHANRPELQFCPQ